MLCPETTTSSSHACMYIEGKTSFYNATYVCLSTHSHTHRETRWYNRQFKYQWKFEFKLFHNFALAKRGQPIDVGDDVVNVYFRGHSKSSSCYWITYQITVRLAANYPAQFNTRQLDSRRFYFLSLPIVPIMVHIMIPNFLIWFMYSLTAIIKTHLWTPTIWRIGVKVHQDSSKRERIVCIFIWTDRHAYFDYSVDSDWEYIYIIGSEMTSKVRCTLLAKIIIPSWRVLCIAIFHIS